MPSVKLTKLSIPVEGAKLSTKVKLTRNYLQKAGEETDYIVYHVINNGNTKAELSLKTLENGTKFVAYQKNAGDRFSAAMTSDGNLKSFKITSTLSGTEKNPPDMIQKFAKQMDRMMKLFQIKK